MTHLPNAAEANVEEIKVRGYLLNPKHRQNGGKAAFFRSFGFEIGRWAMMRDTLLQHAVANQISGTSLSSHGTKYTVHCSIETPDGRDPCVTTVWIIEGNRPPRLVTSYP